MVDGRKALVILVIALLSAAGCDGVESDLPPADSDAATTTIRVGSPSSTRDPSEPSDLVWSPTEIAGIEVEELGLQFEVENSRSLYVYADLTLFNMSLSDPTRPRFDVAFGCDGQVFTNGYRPLPDEPELLFLEPQQRVEMRTSATNLTFDDVAECGGGGNLLLGFTDPEGTQSYELQIDGSELIALMEASPIGIDAVCAALDQRIEELFVAGTNVTTARGECRIDSAPGVGVLVGRSELVRRSLMVVLTPLATGTFDADGIVGDDFAFIDMGDGRYVAVRGDVPDPTKVALARFVREQLND